MPSARKPLVRMLARAAVALGLIAAIPAAATEHTVFASVWLRAAPPAPQAIPALLSMPPAWSPGDAAAVVVSDPAVPGGPRDLLVARLLGDGAAVLELDVFTPRGFSADGGANPPLPDAAALVPDLFAALAQLRREAGAGVVVAIGFGLGGEAAVAAARIAAPDGEGFAAGIDAGPHAMRFAAGSPPPAKEAWPMRLAPLCEVVGAFGRGCIDVLGSRPRG